MCTKLTYTRKPRKCPIYGFYPVAIIYYGMPAYSDKLQIDIDAGKITLWGCIINNPINQDFVDPAWECTKCHNKFFRSIPPWLLEDPTS